MSLAPSKLLRSYTPSGSWQLTADSHALSKAIATAVVVVVVAAVACLAKYAYS